MFMAAIMDAGPRTQFSEERIRSKKTDQKSFHKLFSRLLQNELEANKVCVEINLTSQYLRRICNI